MKSLAWRNMLSNAHCVGTWSRCIDRLFPNENVWRSTVQLSRNLAQEQTQRNAALNEMRQRYKEKTQQLADVKTVCKQEARIKTLEAQRARLQAGQALPTLWFRRPPGGRGVSALEPGVNQSRLLALENEVKKLGEEGATLVATGRHNKAASA
ncbi:hypothetical protein ACNKHW_02150 [Shigella flexneri]